MDEGTKTLILWLIFLALNAIPVWETYKHFSERERFKDILADLEEDLLLRKGHGIWREAENRDPKPIPWPSIFLFGIIGGVVTQNVFAFLLTLALWTAAAFLGRYWEYAAPIVNMTLAQKRQAIRQAAQTAKFNTRASFESPPDDDDAFFSSKSQQKQRERERPRQEHKPPPKQETPYGFDKRHPKDAKLWAVVDDPNASDGERQAAFSAILKRNAQRKRGEDPNTASDADVTRLIGSDRK